MNDALWTLIEGHSRGVLVTVKRDGRPQLSNVGYLYNPAARTALISVTADRAKTRNLARDPRVSLYVTTTDLGAYAVAEGVAALGAIADAVDDPATDGIVEHYRAMRGEHPDWAAFRAAMVSEQRLLVRVSLDRVYGWTGDG
ncbi:PPOX class F420-dependent oxidoreductase [soil metagenome]